MKVVRDRASLREALAAVRREGRGIAIVPTMGALHDGHMSLVDLARGSQLPGQATSPFVVLTIFVNSIQFNNSADLNRYPRTLETDLARCEVSGVDLVFAPDHEEIYPWSKQVGGALTSVALGANDLSYQPSRITAGSASRGLCGATRPGHFDGVTTVVGILFQLIRPDIAVFGDKDFQQVRVIEQMVSDLHFGVEIVRAPIVREQDGLALSSRNVLLDAQGRYHALYIPQTLRHAAELVAGGERDVTKLLSIVRDNLERTGGLRVDYVEIVSPETLEPASGTLESAAQLVVAAFAGEVRLIDNIRLEPARRA